MTQDRADYRVKNVWEQMASWACLLSMFFAGLWIASGLAEYAMFLPRFLQFDGIARASAGAWMAFVSILLVVLLIYTKPNQRKPDKLSIYALAPLVLVVALGSAIFMLFVVKAIIPDVISGLSLLGLSIGVARTLPFSVHPNA